jgi:hypothetical protein
MDVADLLITTAIALIGLYLTHSLRRQQRLRIAEKRLDSYRRLWALMEVVRPSRLIDVDGSGPLTHDEARKLYQDATHWYFEDGNGMLLTERTRTLYFLARANLGEYATDQVENSETAVRIMRQFSLLRTQMKLDIDRYGTFGLEAQIDEDDRNFLRSAGIGVRRWGWAAQIRTRLGDLLRV